MRFLCFLVFIGQSGTVLAQSTALEEAITPILLAGHVHALAHDSLEGRATGSVGELKACRYVARQFERLHLRAAGSSSTLDRYFQPYIIYRRGWGVSFLKTATRAYNLYEHFYVNGLPAVPTPQTLDVVFGGYGIDASTYSDYAQLDVRGKVVVVWQGEPRQLNGRYWLTGSDQPSRWSDDALAWKRKVKAAKEHGAAFLFIISSAKGAAFREEMTHRQVLVQRLNKVSTEPIVEVNNGPAAYIISDSLAQDALGVTAQQLTIWQQQADSWGQTAAQPRPTQLTIQSPRLDLPINTRNVLGWIGGVEKPDEVVVVSAHVDHLGKSVSGVIFNGADDDASGVAGVLAIAEAVALAQRAGYKPRRSILFAVFTGEELGLLGSYFYVRHPQWLLTQTVCNLNIDMVGRIDEAHRNSQPYVYVLGASRLSGGLQQAYGSVKTNALTVDDRFDRDDPQDFFSRSDQYNFVQNQVPAIQYFTGVHPDYHQPTDDADRIQYERQALIVRQIFRTLQAIAGQPDR
jgi:hypothetical protein